MVDHLRRSHGFSHPARAQAQAEEFKSVSAIKYWSCGFCICIFDSFKDRLNHIGQHFANETLQRDQWSVSTVIQGLLRQEEVATAWQRLLPARRDANPLWQYSLETAQLIHGLQMGIPNANVAGSVVEALYAASDLGHLNDVDAGLPSLLSSEMSMTLDGFSEMQW